MSNWSMDWQTFGGALRRRAYIVAIAAVVGLVAAVMLAKHSHEYSAESAVVLVTSEPNQNSADNGNAQLTVQSADLPTLAQSTTVLTDVARRIGYTGDPTNLDSHVRAHITLLSSVMPIDYTSNTADGAVQGANAVADSLTDYYRTISTSRFTKLIDDLQSQITAHTTQLAKLDAQIAGASAANPYLDSRSGTSAINAQIIDLKSRRASIEANAEGDTASVLVLSKLLNDVRPLATSEIAEASPLYRTLRDQYAHDASELARVQTQYPLGYPGLPGLRDEASRDRAQVKQAESKIAATSPLTSKSYTTVLDEKMTAQAKVQNDIAQEQALDRQIAAQTAMLSDSSSQNVSIAALRRNRDAAEAAYAQLASRLTTAQADRAAAASTGAISVIDRATHAKGKALTKGLEAGIALLVLSLAAGLGLVYLLEVFDTRLNSRRRLEDLYGTAVFTTIG